MEDLTEILGTRFGNGNHLDLIGIRDTQRKSLFVRFGFRRRVATDPCAE